MKKICYVVTISVTIRAFFIKQVRYLADNGFDVTVICSPDETLGEELGDKIRYIPVYIARGVEPKTLIGTIKELRDIFYEEEFDLVQYSTPNAAFCASIAARLAKVGVRNYHLMGLRYLGFGGIKRFIFKQIERITCGLSTDIECITKSNLDLAVSKRLFKREKAVIVGSGSTGGVDLTRFDHRNRNMYRAEIRNELGIGEAEFLFGFVGRVTRDKGIDELLEAFFSLKTEAKLMIVGDREGLDTLDQRLWSKAVANERVLILDSTDEIEKYYSAMDVLVLPTYREGFGMVVAEAGAMGVPSVISNIPGPVDVIEDGITGITFEVQNSKDLAEKMEYLAETPELVRIMSENSVNFIAENFDSDILCEKILERKTALLG